MSKTLIKFSFVMLFFALTSSFDLLAQESGLPIDPERNTEEEFPTENEVVREGGMIITDKDDVKSLQKTNSISTESTPKKEIVKPSKKEKEETTSESVSVTHEDDESVLSFNFLYYLIQKFKFNAVE